MSAEADILRKASAILQRSAIKLQTALKLALSRGGRLNFGSGQMTHGPLGKNTVPTLPRNQRGRVKAGLKAGRGVFQGMTGRYSEKGNLLGLVQRSLPGEPPMFQSGRLRNSISYEMLGPFMARVGTNVKYARYLEFGTKGGKVIVPKSKKALYDPVSRRFFGKRVVQGAIKPRPFFRPTIARMRGEIAATISEVR